MTSYVKMYNMYNMHEEQILNTVWIGLLGLEVLMVLGVILQAIVKRCKPLARHRSSRAISR
jgi:hypothetical protein